MNATTVKAHTRRSSAQYDLARKAMHNELARDLGRSEPYPDLDIPFPPQLGINVKDVTLAVRDAVALGFFLSVALVALVVLA